MKKSKIKTQNLKRGFARGFAALVMVILVSSALLVTVLANTNAIAIVFDEANHKQYRYNAMQNALTCLDTAMLEITHDYFYEVGTSAIPSLSYSSEHCSIISVTPTSGTTESSGYRTITVSGISDNVTAVVVAQVLLSDRKISLLSKITYF